MEMELEYTVEQVKRRYQIIGNAIGLNRAIEMAIRVAPTDATVLIYGENGVGKDVFGRLIHDLSHRRHQPFMAINCGAIPEGTLDSELFGHEKGAFTSAYESRKGYFEEVNGGTLFLDEIGEMPLSTQARLLRVLETGEYLRVGSSKVRKTDVRIVAATNKNLLALIRENKFREDLYFRLNTVFIQIPPLRERGKDVLSLFEHFALEFAEKYHRTQPLQLTPDAEQLLLHYHWPGNVRELKNLVEKLSILLPSSIVDSARLLEYYPFLNTEKQIAHLPIPLSSSIVWETDNPSSPAPSYLEQLQKGLSFLSREMKEIKTLLYALWQLQNVNGNPLPSSSPPLKTGHPNVQPQKQEEEPLLLTYHEKRLIQKALKRYHGNRKKAAKALGISERTLYRKIKEYDITLDE